MSAEKTQTPATPEKPSEREALLEQFDVQDPGIDFEEFQKPADKAKAPEREEPAKPKHSAQLLDAARALGIDDEEALTLSASELRSEIRMARLEAAIAKQGEPRQEKKVEAREEEEPESEFDDEWDPKLVKLIKTRDAKIDKLTKLVESQHENERRREIQSFQKRFDDQIADLGEEFESIFGSGGLTELPKGSPELAARKEILAAMDAFDQTYKTLGTKKSDDELFKLAADHVIRQRAAKPARRRAAEPLEDDAEDLRPARRVAPAREPNDVRRDELRRQGALRPPTERVGAEKKDPLATMREYMRDHNLIDDRDLLDTMP